MLPLFSRQDVIAGLSVAGLLLPEAIAYGAIAGFGPAHALIAAMVGLIVYAIAGRCRVAIVAPTSASAATLAAASASLVIADPAQRLLAASAMVAVAGMLFLAAGALRLGFVAAFVSRPVLRGFAIGLAASIVIKQIGGVTNVTAAGDDTLLVLGRVLAHADSWNIPSLAIGAGALGIAILLRRWRGVPAALVLLILGIALSYTIDLTRWQIGLVGPIAPRLTMPALPSLDRAEWHALALAVFPLALIVFVESWGTMRSLALNHGDRVDPNRELLALGCANLAAGLAGGQAVGAGFSASAANDSAGASSRIAGLVAALGLALLMLVALPLVAHVPKPVLAAVVVSALLHALDPAPLRRLWRIDRDQFVALAAAVGVLVLGVLYGMLVAVVLSVLAIVRRIAQPSVVQLGRLGEGRDFADLARHADARVDPGIVVFRPGEPMFFANAERIMTLVEARAAAARARTIVLSLEESADLDSTAVDVLDESATRLEAAGRLLVLARVKDPIRDLLEASGGGLAALAARSTRSVADAVDAAKRHDIAQEKTP